MGKDPLIKDDQFFLLNIKDKGLVIITGCADWNNKYYTVRKGVKWEDRIYAIMGGIHLTGEMFEPLIPKIINELERVKPNS